VNRLKSKRTQKTAHTAHKYWFVCDRVAWREEWSQRKRKVWSLDRDRAAPAPVPRVTHGPLFNHFFIHRLMFQKKSWQATILCSTYLCFVKRREIARNLPEYRFKFLSVSFKLELRLNVSLFTNRRSLSCNITNESKFVWNYYYIN
jgi:hypothetical protein